ncbi:MAG: nucleoside-diphosphate-sugar epimerase [Enterobacterales bacterium]
MIESCCFSLCCLEYTSLVKSQHTILVTGATGFVGQDLVVKLLAEKNNVISGVRRKSPVVDSELKQLELGDLSSGEAVFFDLASIDVIIHTAACVHIMTEATGSVPLTEFRKVNTTATINLAKQAAEAGVKRFIFLSSIKVNGEMTSSGRQFKPNDDFIPSGPYPLSKYEAEKGLLEIAKETGMEVVIIRPPLVYGPSVKANFSSMMKWVNKGIPLPFGAIDNKRSFVALDNLVSFIIHCIEHPKAANEIFLISDGEDVSTTELLNKVAKAFGVKARLLPIPVSIMTFAATLIGKKAVANRLFSSLQVDSSKARDLLDWKPVITMDEQLKKTAEAYIGNEKNL